MENPTVAGLRSRSRSKTPFLRSSCDREQCAESEDHIHHKAGRKTPVKRSTPIKQLQQSTKRDSVEIIEEDPDNESSSTYRTRQSARVTEKLVKTSDYSSEESLDRLKGHRKEIVQNEINSQYERVSTSSKRYRNLEDLPFSPISSHNVTQDRSTRFGSPAYSACSTDSSFAEQALADASVLLEREPTSDHLPYRLYKMAGEYWNKYPKTDYTYSRLSRDRVELAPGQVAVPNMSRRSLTQFRVQGPIAGDVTDMPRVSSSTWQSSAIRKRYTSIDSSDDESAYVHNGSKEAEERWWITRLLVTVLTAITTTTSNTYRRIVGPSHRYPYTERRPAKANILSRTASVLTAPFYWIYSIVKTVVTTTVTTVTETITPNHVSENEKYVARSYKTKEDSKRRTWPWLMLLLLPAFGYGWYNYSELLMEKPALDTYSSPVIERDVDLVKRIAALENWAMNVDSKLKAFDQKLATLDSVDLRIEQYSLKTLQQNLIQTLSTSDNVDILSERLKTHFDKYYVPNSRLDEMRMDIDNMAASWKPDMSEDTVRRIVQEHLSSMERRYMELIVERVEKQVKEIERQPSEVGANAEEIRKIVAAMLDVYDADKTGMVDYALESAGGQVISTKCTELYQIKTKQYSVLGLPVLWVYTSPRYALTPGAMPAECWAFQGFPGYLVIRTYAVIEVTGFSLEHMSRLLAIDGKIESAPRNFSVYGLSNELDPEPHLFGDYTYDANGTSIQYFPVKHPKTTNIGGAQYPVAHNIVELRVESNHGNPTYTCVYRFRVHGNPLSDIRRATDDSIIDSET